MEENRNNKLAIMPVVIGVLTLLVIVIGATYSYFTIGGSNTFGTRTLTTSTPDVGSVTLTSGDGLTLNMTRELMTETNVGTYYATTTGTPSPTLVETNIATATVTGTGNFNCTYDLTITPTSTNSLYTAFMGMTGHGSEQIVLRVGNTNYDFNVEDFSAPITIHESFSNITSSSNGVLKASLYFKNADLNQDALQGKDITLTFTASNLSCTAVKPFEVPTIGNFVTLDNIPGIYYRVLYNEYGSTYMLLRMNNDLGTLKYNETSTTVAFENGSSYQKYAGSTLDTYMNETYYNTLSTNIKNAIVDKNIDQKAYELKSDTEAKTKGDTTYTYQYEHEWGGDSNYRAANYLSKVNVGTRHVYALEIDDIYKYMSALKGSIEREITSTELMNMFFNISGNTKVRQHPWLRSANAGRARSACFVNSNYGDFSIDDAPNTHRICPAFLIDLSKVDFEEIDPSTITAAQLGN